MVAQLQRSRNPLSPTMDTAFDLPGAGYAVNSNPATQAQHPIAGGMPAGQVHALPHMAWQQRPRGQLFPQMSYVGQGQLPPPIPPGMAAAGHHGAAGGGGQGATQFMQLSPSGLNIPIPPSDVGSTAPQGPDLESATPQTVGQPTAWLPDQTPSATQQQAMDMAMLTASMQSMAMTLQQLLTENQRLAEELKSIKTERAVPPEKPEESSPKHAFGGTAGVKRPLIGSFDREATHQPDAPKVP